MSRAALFIDEPCASDFESFVKGLDVREKDRLVRTALQSLEMEPSAGSEVAPDPRPRLFPIFSLGAGGREYELRTPLGVSVYSIGEAFLAESEYLDISAYGLNANEALSSFRESFDVMFREICMVDIDTLAPDAISVRERMLDILGL